MLPPDELVLPGDLASPRKPVLATRIDSHHTEWVRERMRFLVISITTRIEVSSGRSREFAIVLRGFDGLWLMDREDLRCL